MSYLFKSSKPFYTQVAQSEVSGYSYINVIGTTVYMGQNTTGTIWDIADTVYPWSDFDSAGTVELARADVGDADIVVTITGLNASLAVTTEDVTLTSASGNTSSTSWKRIYKMSVPSSNAGNITATKDGTEVARITAGMSETLMCVYTVPADKIGYITSCTLTAKGSAECSGLLMVRSAGTGPFKIKHAFEASSSPYFYNFNFPIELPAGSDVDLRIITEANHGRYSAAFDILLVG